MKTLPNIVISVSSEFISHAFCVEGMVYALFPLNQIDTSQSQGSVSSCFQRRADNTLCYHVLNFLGSDECPFMVTK